MITNITDLDTPALLVDLDIMEANIARAAADAAVVNSTAASTACVLMVRLSP